MSLLMIISLLKYDYIYHAHIGHELEQSTIGK